MSKNDNYNEKNRLFAEVKEKTDFLAFYERETRQPLKAGKNLVLCPLHDDKKPSLSIDTDTGGFKCLSTACDKHGDIFEFYMARHGVSKKDALHDLAAAAGVEIKPTGSDAAAKKAAKMKALYDRHCAGIPLPTEASDYLESRGLVKETTIRHLVNSRLVGFKADAHCKQLESKIPAIIFPLFDASGQELLGFQKIFYKENIDKEYEAGSLGKKAFFFADKNPLTGRQCVVTEAVIDALSVWQSVDREKYAAVSVMSSSTPKKAKYLKAADEIILAMDNDQAGNVARDKAGKAIGKCRSVCWTEDDPKDMNDLLKTGKEDRIRELVENAEEFESPEPDLTETAGCDPDKPTINPGKMQLTGKLAEAWAALEKYNDPPKIFRTEIGTIVSIAGDETRLVDRVLMREHLAEAANWIKTVYGNDMPDDPPNTIIESVMAHPEKFPLLKKVIPCPVFSSDGKLHITPGYDPDTCFFLPEKCAFPVSRMPIKTAREILFDWLIDFPFDSEASRANAIAAAVTPFVRAIIGEKPMPRMFFTAPVAGTGKGKLANVLALPFRGKEIDIITECKNEEELQKIIVSEFMDGTPDYIFFDNLIGKIKSAKFAAWATTYAAKGRILGVNQSVRIPVNAPVWLMTANNPELDKDNARRSLNICIDAGMERPETRTGYKHKEIEDYTLENRQEILSALLSLCLEWIDAGKPDPTRIPPLGSFETWVSVVGGVLEFAGFDALMANNKKFIEDSDSDTADFKSLLEMLEPGKKYKGKDLMQIIQAAGLEGAFPDSAAKLGRQILTKQRNRVFELQAGEFIFERESISRNSANWRIIPKERVRVNLPSPIPSHAETQEYQWMGEGVRVSEGNQADEKRNENDNAIKSHKGNTHTHIDIYNIPHSPSLPHPTPENTGEQDVRVAVRVEKDPHLDGEPLSCEACSHQPAEDASLCLTCKHYKDAWGWCEKFSAGYRLAFDGKCQGRGREELAN